MTWRSAAEGLQEGGETLKVHDRIAPYVTGRGVDLGCGFWKLVVPRSAHNYCLGVDGAYHSENAPTTIDIFADVTNLDLFADESFDYVYSSHTLEDLEYTEAVLREWWRLVKLGGRLILYLPLTRLAAKKLGRADWETFYPNMKEVGANVYHKHDFDPAEIRAIIGRIGHAEILADEVRGEKDEYSFLQVYKKLGTTNSPILSVSAVSAKKALVVRYGAIGDCIQSTPVFRKLKEEGYHVTVNASDVATDVLRHNPNIDSLALQIRDYVPNTGTTSGALLAYWNDLATHYDKFINLTGAAEESLLVPDSRVLNIMADLKIKHPELREQDAFFNSIVGIRKAVGDVNYYDNHLAKAGYPDKGLNGELFFTTQEEVMAQGFRDKYPGRFIVMWVLSGSSYHKRYPYFQQVAQELIIKNPDILLISVGDPECALIERAESNRYLPRAGRWALRTSLVMTKYADLVIGPETGILNASGCFDTPKITFLSHSSHDNLCKYWKNDFCIHVDQSEVFCYPCHVLHYTHAVNQECPTCKGHTHAMMNPNPEKSVAGGMWTCPYEVPDSLKDEKGEGSPSPLCTTRLTPQRVLGRVNEVYKLWKSGAFRESRPYPV